MNCLLIFILGGTIYSLSLPADKFSNPKNFSGSVDLTNGSLWILFVNYSLGIASLDLAIFKQIVEWFVMLQLIIVQKGKDYKDIMCELQDPSRKLKEKLKGIRYKKTLIRNERVCLQISKFFPVIYLLILIPCVFYCTFYSQLLTLFFYRGIFEVLYILYSLSLLLMLDFNLKRFHRFEYDITKRDRMA